MVISYDSFVKFHGEKIWETQHDRVFIQICVITGHVIKGLLCIYNHFSKSFYKVLLICVWLNKTSKKLMKRHF